MLKPLTPTHAKPAWKFLSRHGLRDVFLASKMHEGALSFPDGAAQGRFLGAFDGAEARRRVVPRARRAGRVRVRIAARASALCRGDVARNDPRAPRRRRMGRGERLLEPPRGTGLTASRDWREVFMVATARCVLDEPEPALRLAVHEDVPVLVDLAARAYKEENGRRSARHHGRGLRAPRRAGGRGEGRSYVIEDRGRLVFKADLSARCPLGAQIVGVFTEPDRRGQGLARRGVAEIVRRLTLPSPRGRRSRPCACSCARTMRPRAEPTNARVSPHRCSIAACSSIRCRSRARSPRRRRAAADEHERRATAGAGRWRPRSLSPSPRASTHCAPAARPPTPRARRRSRSG